MMLKVQGPCMMLRGIRLVFDARGIRLAVHV